MPNKFYKEFGLTCHGGNTDNFPR